MYPTKQKIRSSVAEHVGKCSGSNESTTYFADWISESVHSGSLRHVDLNSGTNDWASLPGDLFSLRAKNYLKKRQKGPVGDYLLTPCSTDWLRSSTKLDNILGRSDNRIANALRNAQAQGNSMKSFIFAVNLQIPSKEQHIVVFYFSTEDPIPAGSLIYWFINRDNSFWNQGFKIVNQIVKGPWIVEKMMGNYSACLLGKALKCNGKGFGSEIVDNLVGFVGFGIGMGTGAVGVVDDEDYNERQEEKKAQRRDGLD